MTGEGDGSLRHLLFALGVAVGVLARVTLTEPVLGFNADFEAYGIVSEIMERGETVYAETPRYNYGPPWFYILHGLRSIADVFDPGAYSFRLAIMAFLTLVDLGITFLLVHLFGRTSGMLFFLNPISVFITGYHGQFDNLAVLVGLIAMTVYAGKTGGVRRHPRARIAGLILLGLSLMVKHILLALPLLLAMKEQDARKKVATVSIPIGVFLLGFIPFLGGGGLEGIVRNVFLYRSRENVPFLRSVLPWSFVHPLESLPVVPVLFLLGQVVFVVAIVWLGLYLRRRDPISTFLIYLIVVVGVSPVMTNQYLAIPSAGLAVYPNMFFALYAVIGGFFLLIQGEGLGWGAVAYHLRIGDGLVGYSLLSLLLVLGLVSLLFGDQLRPWWNRIRTSGRAWVARELGAERRTD